MVLFCLLQNIFKNILNYNETQMAQQLWLAGQSVLRIAARSIRGLNP